MRLLNWKSVKIGNLLTANYNHRLKELFQTDNERFRQELMAKESTTDSRVDAMKARVAELKANRETERKKIVEEKLLQQWR
jgi:hypothetical protein